MDIEGIKISTQRFRVALDEHHECLGLPFDHFPHGCCGDASELLAAFLADDGLGKFQYVSGWREDGSTSHAWLEQHNVIIDVTVDQFADCAGWPFVTVDRTWHMQFSSMKEARDDGDFRKADSPPQHLLIAYAKLTNFIQVGSCC